MKLLPCSSPKLKLLLLSIMHLVTDGLCSLLVFSRLYPENPEMAFIVFLSYNILAFVTQSPVGLLIDRYNKPKIFLAISAGLLALGYLFSGVCMISVLFIGFGNSLFHVAGGKYVSDKSGNSITDLGIFVSTGAVGLVLGQRYFSALPLTYIFFSLLLLSLLMLLISKDPETLSYPEEYSKDFDPRIAMMAVLGVVFARSLVGKTVSADFELTGHIFLVISIATALGKAMGGIASRLFGIRITTAVSMSVAALCLSLGLGNPYTYLLGIFAFNFSMPITLYYANILLKGKEGFAFGTLAATLAPGYFLAMLLPNSKILNVFTAILCILSILVINKIFKRISNAKGPIISNDNT